MTQFGGPLYVVGSPRSGTKLLRELLNRNPMINLCDPESHFIPHLFNKFGGDPDVFDVNLDEFHAEFERMPFQVFAHRMDKPSMQRADFDALEGVTNWTDAWEIILRFYGEPGKRPDAIWGDKTPSYVLDMPMLKRITPAARFVHIIRDPRDVALSVHAAWKHNMQRSAMKWARNVAQGRKDGAALGADYMEIYYEDMLGDTAATLGKICDFVGVPFAQEMTSLARPSENIGSAAGKTFIDTSNLGKFRAQMDPAEQRRLEEIVFEQAQNTPYEMDYATAYRPLTPINKAVVAAADGSRSLLRYVRTKGLVDGIKINIGNRLQKRRRSS